uniref:Uncharacterized protein n=1 Tax=mine drainage metagenome TaxID=410659 RepID=E6QLZ6_9ZZZZ
MIGLGVEGADFRFGAGGYFLHPVFERGLGVLVEHEHKNFACWHLLFLDQVYSQVLHGGTFAGARYGADEGVPVPVVDYGLLFFGEHGNPCRLVCLQG